MSTRLFVRGLPATLTEDQFRAHFATRGNVTDAKLIPHRRIGYIGYKTSDEACAAVKYFNKTFIRTSRIGVELTDTTFERRGGSKKQSAALHNVVPTIRQESAGPKLKRKHDGTAEDQPNKKLQEFLDVMAPSEKSNTWSNADHTTLEPVAEPEDEDDEYVDLPALKKPLQPPSIEIPPPSLIAEATMGLGGEQGVSTQTGNEQVAGPISDADWLRSKTSRLLDFTDDVTSRLADALSSATVAPHSVTSVPSAQPEDAVGENAVGENAVAHDSANPVEQAKGDLEQAIEAISNTGRLFVRNLPYSATEYDIRQTFAPFGELEEVHLPIDNKTQASKGFVYVQFKSSTDAVEAFRELDRKGFQGRLLHIIPAAPKRETKLNGFEISKLPLKKQRELKRKASAATSQFSWNSMYMNADAVMSSVAHKLGVSKADLLDPSSSDAAVKQAHAETHVIQQTKEYFVQSGIDLKAFESCERDGKVILIKNFPFGTTSDELRKLLEEHGALRQLLMPPAGTIAIAEFHAAPSARSAFAGLAYRRFKEGILFIEKGPKGLFTGRVSTTGVSAAPSVDAKVSAGDLKDTSAPEQASENVTTLFVRNLNFSTTAEGFTAAFKSIDGFRWARVKTKPDPKKPGQMLSMGFGFVGFSKPEQARAAQAAMDGYALDGHKLLIKMAHKGADVAAETQSMDAAKNDAANRTKIIIKNLPFEVTKQDVRSLFGKYGTLRTVRMPKKFAGRTRGFAFAEFVSGREAASAMAALKDTHLLGRRLVLEHAHQNTKDAEEEIERMTKKTSKQSDIVALARLKENSKSKVVLDESGAVEEAD
ncbi:hypothetical protein FN846DRAFT_976300 [Sphaerosporella brunnea]|uniref:Multiple RNA-binding domain-containing protein 1 n=1 Tax=Sphaerosporella brunnea TaxID=1250544 RepID=A0A5J5EFK8_9PEZI|nr:hypothetical protein FN846DRAFT_976300 [Sphaerosporella brunnea]